MQTMNQQPARLLSPPSFFVLRTPLLPFEELLEWGTGLNAARACGDNKPAMAMETAWHHDVDRLRKRLMRISDRPEIMQALLLASPSLESSLQQWRLDPGSKKGLQTERALTRYFNRMAGRPTPFGTFAGYSIGTVEDVPHEESGLPSLDARERYTLHSRLDYGFLCALTEALEQSPGIAEGLRYCPNSSLHRVGQDWHYVKTTTTESRRAHHAVKLEEQPYLETLIQSAADGATIDQLSGILVQQPADPPLAPDEALAYIRDLIAEQVWVSRLSPLVTTGRQSALGDVIAQLEVIPAGTSPAAVLRSAETALALLDANGLGAPRGAYEQIAAGLASLPVAVDLSRLFQTDMKKPLEHGGLPAAVTWEVIRALEVLAGSEVMRPRESEKLVRFRESFQARYGQQWVPLLTALDRDLGIEFDGGDESLRDGSPRMTPGNKTPEAPPGRFYEELSGKYVACLRSGEEELVLDAEDLHGTGTRPQIEDGFSVLFTLSAESAAHVGEGKFEVYLRSTKGPTGAALLGRFCHADEELRGLVQSHLRNEEKMYEDAVCAEIVHLPDGRLGNVASRPVFREFEIPYLGRSGAGEENQLPADDLLVTVAFNEILLFSRRLGKRVIPRLTNAHRFDAQGCPLLYRFLGHLQYSRKSEIRLFDWGPLAQMPYLPRVRLGRVILAVARWRLTAEEIHRLSEHAGAAGFCAVQRMREQRGLPRWILLEDDDNTLPVDLDNPLSVDAFLHLIRRGGAATLQEMYPQPGQLCIMGPEGHFQHEFVLPLAPFCRAEEEDAVSRDRFAWLGSNLRYRSMRRSFAPGSEWLYVKVYGGTASLDQVLLNELRSLIISATQHFLAQSWFFIRYADPDPHLRIRLRGDPERLVQDVLPLLTRLLHPLIGRGLWRVELGTYEQEIERYGGPEGMRASEQVFFHDSEAVVAALAAIGGTDEVETRIQVAMVGADRLLRDCRLSLDERRELTRHNRDAFARELNLSIDQRGSLGERFRRNRKVFSSLIAETGDQTAGQLPQAVGEIFAARSRRLKETVEELLALEQGDPAAMRMDDLVRSYVHLHINRMMRSHPRRQEAVIYDFLYRTYTSIVAQG